MHWQILEKARYFTTWQPEKQVNHLGGLCFHIQPLQIGKNLHIHYGESESQTVGDKTSLNTDVLCLSEGFAGFHSVLQELGFKGTLVG